MPGHSLPTSSFFLIGRASTREIRRSGIERLTPCWELSFVFCPTFVLKQIHAPLSTTDHALSSANILRNAFQNSMNYQLIAGNRKFSKHPLSCDLATWNEPGHGGLNLSTNTLSLPPTPFPLPPPHKFLSLCQ